MIKMFTLTEAAVAETNEFGILKERIYNHLYILALKLGTTNCDLV